MRVLINLNPCEAPENSPASWCKKSESKGAVVPPADFLLEADKRGSPPKSEKAAAFWEHNKKELGGAWRGVQPFLRKETSEINDKNGERFAESSADSARYAQNLWEKSNKKSLLKFLLLFAFVKRRVPLNYINFNPSSKADSQNLAKKIARIFE